MMVENTDNGGSDDASSFEVEPRKSHENVKKEMKNVVENEEPPSESLDALEDERDSENSYFHLPPLVTTEPNRESLKRVHRNKLLKAIDIIGVNAGSVCFIVGSIYFYPFLDDQCKPMTRSCSVVGAALFIIGSFFFLQGSIISYYLSGADISADWGLTVNALLYILANFLFLVGSIFFIPSVVHEDGVALGISLFVIGSLIFVVAPAYNIYRAIDFRREGRISDYQYHVTFTTASLYILGSSGFVIGSVFFLPGLYQEWSVTVFVASSALFQVATLLVPLKYANGTQLPCFKNSGADRSLSTITDVENPIS